MAKEQKANDRIRLLIEVLAEAEGDAHQIDECIKAAQEMVRDGSLECRSVDRVRAMAALVHTLQGNYYLVPNGLGSVCAVWRGYGGELRCPSMSCRSVNNCDHTHAVKLYLENQK